MTDLSAEFKALAEYRPTHKVRFVTAASLFDGHDAAIDKLERAYAWLDHELAGRTWALGNDFTMADCAAAPSLFYADWVHRIPETYPVLRAYRTRLLARPSFARCVEEARPYRPLFPLGAPDRD